MLAKKRLLYMTGIMCLIGIMALALLFFVANETSAVGVGLPATALGLSPGDWPRAALPAITLVATGLLPVIILIRRSAQPVSRRTR